VRSAKHAAAGHNSMLAGRGATGKRAAARRLGREESRPGQHDIGSAAAGASRTTIDAKAR